MTRIMNRMAYALIYFVSDNIFSFIQFTLLDKSRAKALSAQNQFTVYFNLIRNHNTYTICSPGGEKSLIKC